jgi:hypothetical protein
MIVNDCTWILGDCSMAVQSPAKLPSRPSGVPQTLLSSSECSWSNRQLATNPTTPGKAVYGQLQSLHFVTQSREPISGGAKKDAKKCNGIFIYY